jgi:hypothetical protein
MILLGNVLAVFLDLIIIITPLKNRINPINDVTRYENILLPRMQDALRQCAACMCGMQSKINDTRAINYKCTKHLKTSLKTYALVGITDTYPGECLKVISHYMMAVIFVLQTWREQRDL